MNIDEQSNAEFLQTMERKLGELAYTYRAAQTSQSTENAIRQYQALLRCMIEFGFTDPLDYDSELPDELLPHEYLQIHKPRTLQRLLKQNS